MGFSGHSSLSRWSSCGYNHRPRTLSFREDMGDDHLPTAGHGYMVDNPLWFESDDEVDAVGSLTALNPEHWEEVDEVEEVESIVRCARRAAGPSGRLFFDPAGDSSNIHIGIEAGHRKTMLVQEVGGERADEHSTDPGIQPFKREGEGDASDNTLKVPSSDPYADFRAAMQELILAHGWMGWGWLQDMLDSNLQTNCGEGSDTVNKIGQYGSAVDALVDMIMEQVFSVPPSSGQHKPAAASRSSSLFSSSFHKSCSSSSSFL